MYSRKILNAVIIVSILTALLIRVSPAAASDTLITAQPVKAADASTDAVQEKIVAVSENKAENAVKADSEAKPATTVATSDKQDEDESAEICDPIAPINQAIFHFNDKLYYWGLKPVATGFSYVMPETARIGFSNAFNNLRSPVNIVNNLLQFEFSRSFLELIRLIFNSVVGVGGFYDASSALLGIEKQEADFGQTLGLYGIGQGCYLVLPVFGPTSFRDGIGMAGDHLMSPPTYLGYFFLNFWEAGGAFVFEKVNSTSFKIGDYEFLTNMSVDPYLAQRNAFVQYRNRKVREAVER
jgi:phospholipid-binding lipoprotein MlaA